MIWKKIKEWLFENNNKKTYEIKEEYSVKDIDDLGDPAEYDPMELDSDGYTPAFYSPYSEAEDDWNMLHYARTHPDAPEPERANYVDAGLDMKYCGEPVTIPRFESEVLSTGIKMEVPPGYMVEIMNRSSIASAGVLVGAHVIDAGYEGEIFINLHNFGQEEFIVRHGDKIAQAVCKPIVTPEPVKVSAGNLYSNMEIDSDRGEGGFGSTGR